MRITYSKFITYQESVLYTPYAKQEVSLWKDGVSLECGYVIRYEEDLSSYLWKLNEGFPVNDYYEKCIIINNWSWDQVNASQLRY